MREKEREKKKEISGTTEDFRFYYCLALNTMTFMGFTTSSLRMNSQQS